MSYKDDLEILTDYLSGLGYKRMPNDLFPDQEPASLQHKSYAITFIPNDTRALTNGGIIQSHGIRLEVIYSFRRSKSNNSLDTIYESWITLLKGLPSLIKWSGEVTPPGFERYQDGNYYKGIYEFYLGTELC